MSILDIVKKGPVIPVMTVESEEEALSMVKALMKGGIYVFEITLRTPIALTAIKTISDEYPEAIVGVGTVRKPEQAELAMKSGAKFIVSPGSPSSLLSAVNELKTPFLPGVSTVSEMMRAYDAGFAVQKLFPAEAVGGVGLLKSVKAPLPDIRFCPTGGIHAGNLKQYLDLSNVICVGGSWILPVDAIANKQWDIVTNLAKQVSDIINI